MGFQRVKRYSSFGACCDKSNLHLHSTFSCTFEATPANSSCLSRRMTFQKSRSPAAPHISTICPSYGGCLRNPAPPIWDAWNLMNHGMLTIVFNWWFGVHRFHPHYVHHDLGGSPTFSEPTMGPSFSPSFWRQKCHGHDATWQVRAWRNKSLALSIISFPNWSPELGRPGGLRNVR